MKQENKSKLKKASGWAAVAATVATAVGSGGTAYTQYKENQQILSAYSALILEFSKSNSRNIELVAKLAQSCNCE